MSNQIVECEPVEPMLTAVENDPVFHKRAQRHFKEGYKDGLTGILHNLGEIPPKFRHHYNAGHTLGLYDSGQIRTQIEETA